MMMEIGDIWVYDTRTLYTGGSVHARHEHWLILDIVDGLALNKIMNHAYPVYGQKDIGIQYMCMETGKQQHKVFHHRDWAVKGKDLDFKGNPYYKKVA